MLQSACSCIFGGLVSSPQITMLTSESVSLSVSESSDLVAAHAIICAVLCLVWPRDSVEDGSSQIQTRGGISLPLLTGISVMNRAGLCHMSHPSRFCDTF